MANDDFPKLTDRELAAAFADPRWAAEFPPVLTIQQAAALLQIPLQTLYQWRSRRLLGGWATSTGTSSDDTRTLRMPRVRRPCSAWRVVKL